MDINALAKYLGDACYVFLTINALWGTYCVILAWRRLKQLRFRNHVVQSEFVEEVRERVGSGDFDGAIEISEASSKALPQLAIQALENRQLSAPRLRQHVAERFQEDVISELENRVSWITTVIKCGPLLGLFGTVLGMMAAFGRIGTGEKVEPHMIADEISIALICTAMGLATAIPLNFLLSSINIRIRKLQESVANGMVRILESLSLVAV